MFRNKVFFERTEIGDRGVSGSIRIECLCIDWGKVGFRGDEVICGIGDEFTIDSSFFWCLGAFWECFFGGCFWLILSGVFTAIEREYSTYEEQGTIKSICLWDDSFAH